MTLRGAMAMLQGVCQLLLDLNICKIIKKFKKVKKKKKTSARNGEDMTRHFHSLTLRETSTQFLPPLNKPVKRADTRQSQLNLCIPPALSLSLCRLQQRPVISPDALNFH